MNFPWEDDYIRDKQPYDQELFEKNFYRFLDVMDKLKFKPIRIVNYHCGYGSSMPSRKYVWRAKDGNDFCSFYENIHVFQFKLKLDGKIHVSVAYPLAHYSFEKEFRETVLEHKPCLSGSTLVLRKNINEQMRMGMQPIKVNPFLNPDLKKLTEKLRKRTR